MLAIATVDKLELVGFKEFPDPIPGYDQALVRVKAISINRGDVYRVINKPPGWRPGWDFAGIVEKQAADGSGPEAGTRVVGLVTKEGWAEFVAVSTSSIAPLPNEVTFAQAATLPVAGMTALRALARGGLLLKQNVLVTGASGGVGRFAIQLAKHAGAIVTALAGSDRRREGLGELGANEVITELSSNGRDFHLILESVGGDTLATSLLRVAKGGEIVSIGNSSDKPTTFDVRDFYAPAAGAKLSAFDLFEDIKYVTSGTHSLNILTSLVADGDLQIDIALEANWKEISKALNEFNARRLAGKVVLHVA